MIGGRGGRRVVRWAALAAGLGALVAVPALLPVFHVYIATEILILGLFACSFNLVFGYTGLLSFGHAAFFGTGAYVCALLLQWLGPAYLWALLAGGAAGGVLALGIGALCVRRNEIYFAMLTLAFGMMVFAVAHQWRAVTGGSDGIAGFLLPGLGLGLGVDLYDPAQFYWLTLAVTGLSLLILYRLVISPFGLLLLALRENLARAGFTGVPVYRYRLYAFAISGLFSGIAGALYAPYNAVVVPDMVHWTQSAQPVLMSVLGGSGYFLGPLLGAAVFQSLKLAITGVTANWMLYLGAVLLAVVLFAPRGVAGLLDDLGRYLALARRHKAGGGGR